MDRRTPGGEEPHYPADDLAAAVLGSTELAVFENVYIAYAAEARGIARAVLGDPDLAADAVHNGFLEILRHLLKGRRWSDPAEARGMVMRNVRWAALKAHRSRVRQRVGFDAALVPADDAMWARVEACALIEEILGQLRAKDREALQLRFVEGWSNVEAARRLGVSVPLFESRLKRALRSARQAARSTGLLPQIIEHPQPALRPLFRRRAGRRPSTRRGLGALATVAATGIAASCFGGWVSGSAHPRGPGAGAHLVAAQPAGPRVDPMRDAVVLDAVALPSGAVLALADGRGCRCLELFRSTDGGATWVPAPGPKISARSPALAVAAHFPADQRILVDPGNGEAMQMSPGFGLLFASSAHAVPTASGLVHAEGCFGARATAYCRGQGVSARHGTRGYTDGAILVASDGRIVYFPETGGALCSTFGGVPGEGCELT